MKKQIKDLKRHDAIRVNKEQYPKIAKLLDEAGIKTTFNKRYTEWSPWEVYDNPDDVILYFKGGWDWSKERYSGYKHYTIHLAKDFLLPEPKFKVGDLVQYCDGFKEVFRIGTVKTADDGYWYHPEGSSTGYKESALDFAPPEEYGTVVESPTKCGSEQRFTVGAIYEFQQEPDTNWHKGKFLGVSDCKGKRYFLSEEDGFEWPVVNMDIREVQPKEITKEDLVGLLNDWLELWDNDLLATIDKSYNSTLDNLGMNTGSILHQLKNNLITQK